MLPAAGSAGGVRSMKLKLEIVTLPAPEPVDGGHSIPQVPTPGTKRDSGGTVVLSVRIFRMAGSNRRWSGTPVGCHVPPPLTLISVRMAVVGRLGQFTPVS